MRTARCHWDSCPPTTPIRVVRDTLRLGRANSFQLIIPSFSKGGTKMRVSDFCDAFGSHQSRIDLEVYGIHYSIGSTC